jgi:hypothetical protein
MQEQATARTAQATRSVAVMLLLAVLGSACTTVMYHGPARGPTKTAVIGSGSKATIESIDGTPVNGGTFGMYEVLPGLHSIVLSGQQTDAGFFANTIHRSGKLGTCFSAKPGHMYDINAILEEGFWTNEVVERQAQTNVAINCDMPPEVAQTTGSNRAVLPKMPRPNLRLFLGLGGDIGGEDLIKATMSSGSTETLSAGSGLVLTMGGTLTPLWIGNSFGLGVGGEIGLKYDSIDAKNASVSLLRYPLSLWIQSYLTLNDRWYLSFLGGGHKEFSPELSGDGDAADFQASFQSPWGWMVGAGFLWADTWHSGLGFDLRYTRIHYSIAGENIDASNVGAELTFYLNL